MQFRFAAPCDYRKPDHRTPYEIYWCGPCDFGHVWERPAPQDVAKFYELDNYYTHHLATTAQKKEALSLADRIRIHIAWRLDKGVELDTMEVRKFLPDSHPKICEIGCGNGSNLLKFRNAGCDVIGVEPDHAAREAARKIIEPVYEGTAENLPSEVRNLKFDIVLMSHVLEHCIDINVAMSSVASILKENGVFIVEVPNCNALGFELYEAAWPWTDIPRHLNFFTPHSLERIFNKYKFHVEITDYRGFCRQFSNSWLQTESDIWQAFNPIERRLPDFKRRSMRFLLKSLFIGKERKYDSIRMLAKRRC